MTDKTQMVCLALRRRVGLCLGVALAGVAAVCGETPETLGFWTFEGTGGQTISETRETVTFSNRVSGSSAALLATYPDFSSTIKGSDAPIPLYTNEVQYAYLFSDTACTGAYVTCTASLFSKARPGGSSGTYGRARSTLCVTNVGAALGASSFTLEFIYRTKYMAGWMRFLQLSSAGCPFTLYTNDKSSGIGYFKLAADTSASQSFPNLRNNEYSPIGANDGDWHHFAVVWDAAARTWTLRVDYYKAKSYQVTDATLGLTAASYFAIAPISSSFNMDDTFIQAVRLTRGDLPVAQMLAVSKYTTPPETIARYRFGGAVGGTCTYCTNDVMDRSDLRLFCSTFKTAASYTNAPKRFVREKAILVKNPAAVGSAETARILFNGDARGVIRALTPTSFTHELFFKTYSTSCSSGHVYFFGESGGTYAQSDGSAVWYTGLTATDDGNGHARLRLFYRSVSGGVASDKYPSDVLIDPNVWYHLALTYDDAARTLTLYLNGKARTTVTFAEGTAFCRGTGFSMPIGNTRCNWNGSFNGAWDEYRVTRRALAPDEFLKASTGDGVTLLVR